MWPWPLIFQPKTCHFYRILGYPKVIQSYTKFWTLWDHSFLSYAADKHTNKQTNKQPETSYPRRPTVLTESAWIIIVNSWTFAILPPPRLKPPTFLGSFSYLPLPGIRACCGHDIFLRAWPLATQPPQIGPIKFIGPIWGGWYTSLCF